MSQRWTHEQIADELIVLLPLLNRIVAGAVRRETGEETTMPQFRVLGLLAEAAQTSSALARRRRVSLQSMGELVQALVLRGWVERFPAPHDRRQQLLRLSELGRAKYALAQQQTMRSLLPLLAALRDDEIDAVQRALPALHRILTQDEGSPTDGTNETDNPGGVERA
ncbi:MarR family transcriptional regulator [Chloroflexia bacterium SDU3-3]|nr:MarR family transcriptional regulator [Chloroflexia bacterium SDU3-3]